MFKVGQKVVCIEGTPSGSVKEGKIYTFVGYSRVHPQGVLLKEAKSKHGDAGFWEHRFRPVDDTWVDELLCKLIEEVEVDELVSA